MASYVRYVYGVEPPRAPVTSVDGRCMGCGSAQVTTGGCIRCQEPVPAWTPTPQDPTDAGQGRE